MKETLFGKTRAEISRIVEELELPPYSTDQICSWLYSRQISSIDEMTNLSRSARAAIRARYNVGVAAPRRVTGSGDGTKKYLYGTPHVGEEGAAPRWVEAAFIPEPERATLCLSTQVGCKMGCLFCMTGRQGFQANLTAGEIINQYRSLPEREDVTNIVYMGMGEPFDNPDPVMRSLEILTADWGYGMSPRRITVSTIGIIPMIRRFVNETSCHLAISMHSPFDEERRRLMPVQHVYPIAEVIAALRELDMPRQRRVSFEYIVFGGQNHSPGHVKEIARLLQGLRCRINLIHFHEIPGSPLRPATDNEMIEFENRLKAKGIPTTIRKSRGQDILAACGLLSTKEFVRTRSPKATTVDY